MRLKRSRRVTAHLDRQERAVNRWAGKTDEERLQWVLEFTERNLDELHPAKLEEIGEDLRQQLPPVGHQLDGRIGPMPKADIRAIQRQISQGLRAALQEHPDWTDPRSGWALPARRVRLVNLGEAQRPVFRSILEGGRPLASIIHAVAALIARIGRRFRACKKCGKPFIGRKRQDYCDGKCSQNYRNSKRARKE